MNGIGVIVEKIPDTVWMWGPGFFSGVLMVFTLIAFLIVFRQLARAYLPAFLESQREQAQAMSRLATCIEGQADKQKFNFERILLSLRILHKDMEGSRSEMQDVKQKLAALAAKEEDGND